MKRFLSLVVILMVFCLPAFGWFTKKDKPLIIFRSKPVTENNIMTPEVEFNKGERIYYLITMPKIQYSGKLYIQIIKMNSELAQTGYSLVLTRDVKLRDEERNYFTDYVVLNSSGIYRMRVYSKDRPTKIFASADFWVK